DLVPGKSKGTDLRLTGLRVRSIGSVLGGRESLLHCRRGMRRQAGDVLVIQVGVGHRRGTVTVIGSSSRIVSASGGRDRARFGIDAVIGSDSTVSGGGETNSVHRPVGDR